MITEKEATKILESEIRKITLRIVWDSLYEVYYDTLSKTLVEDKARREASVLCVQNTWNQYTDLTTRMRREFFEAIKKEEI